jgi:hypothetical protein
MSFSGSGSADPVVTLSWWPEKMGDDARFLLGVYG